MFHKFNSYPFARTHQNPRPTSQFYPFAIIIPFPITHTIQPNFEEKKKIAPKNSHLPRPYLLLLHGIEPQVRRGRGWRWRGWRRSWSWCRPPCRTHPAGPSATSSTGLHAKINPNAHALTTPNAPKIELSFIKNKNWKKKKYPQNPKSLQIFNKNPFKSSNPKVQKTTSPLSYFLSVKFTAPILSLTHCLSVKIPDFLEAVEDGSPWRRGPRTQRNR